MGKKFFLGAFLLCTLCFSQRGFSKQSDIDSLLTVLRGSKEDTIKANILNALSKKYAQEGQYALSTKNAQDALSLSQKLHFKKGESAGYMNIGIIQFYQANYPAALKNYTSALRLSEELGDKKIEGHAYNNIGLVYTYQGNYDAAIKSYSAALKNYLELGDTVSASKAYNNLGIIYDEQGNYPEALKSYLATLKIVEKINDKKAMADAYLNIGLVYDHQNNYEEALKNYAVSLKLCEEINYKQGIANCSGNMAIAYESMNELPRALEYSQKALKISEELGEKGSAGLAYNASGDINTKMKKYEDAFNDYMVGLKIFQEIGDKTHESESYSSLGFLYRKQNLFSKAIESLNKALYLQKEVGSKERVSQTYGLMSDVYRDMKDFEKAYQYQKLYLEAHDSVYNEAKSKQIAEMKTKYETEKKDAEINLLNKDKEVKDAEIKKQKTLKYSFVGGLAAVLILSVVVFSNFRVRSKLKLQRLRNKIASDLHDDVGSTLSSIAIFSEVAQQQSKEIIPMLNTIGDSARNMLDAMADIVWTINPENDNFEKIILRMRSFAYELLGAKKIEFEFEADDEVGKKKLPMDVRKNLYLIFKEATNNMVKYSGADKASFVIKGGKNELTMLIRDNGKGFDTTKETIGNGLKNMKKRAEEIGARLLVESIPGSGTTIQLLLGTV